MHYTASETFEIRKSGYTRNDGKTLGIDAKEQRGSVRGHGIHCGEQIQGWVHRVHERSESIPGPRAARPRPSHAASERVFQQRERDQFEKFSDTSPGRAEPATALRLQPERHTVGRARFVLRRSAGADQIAQRRHSARFAVQTRRNVAAPTTAATGAHVHRRRTAPHAAVHAVRFFWHRVARARPTLVVLLDGQLR